MGGRGGYDRGGYGGGRRGYGGMDQRGRGGMGYGRRDGNGRPFIPNSNMSKMAGHSHKAQAISKFEKFPGWIKEGCQKDTGNENDPVVTKLNGLQEKVMA